MRRYFGRILFLLSQILDAGSTICRSMKAYAAYFIPSGLHHCLKGEAVYCAYRASWSILDHGGLWWSIQLAHFVKHYNSQIIESIDASTVNARIPARSYRTTLKTLNTRRDSSYHISKVQSLVLESLFSSLKQGTILKFNEVAWGNTALTIPNTHIFSCSSPTEEHQFAIELVR